MDDLARGYFWEKIPVTLSYAQASILLCMGLQGKDISSIEVPVALLVLLQKMANVGYPSLSFF